MNRDATTPMVTLGLFDISSAKTTRLFAFGDRERAFGDSPSPASEHRPG
jgi:hypothetical protein